MASPNRDSRTSVQEPRHHLKTELTGILRQRGLNSIALATALTLGQRGQQTDRASGAERLEVVAIDLILEGRLTHGAQAPQRTRTLKGNPTAIRKNHAMKTNSEPFLEWSLRSGGGTQYLRADRHENALQIPGVDRTSHLSLDRTSEIPRDRIHERSRNKRSLVQTIAITVCVVGGCRCQVVPDPVCPLAPSTSTVLSTRCSAWAFAFAVHCGDRQGLVRGQLNVHLDGVLSPGVSFDSVAADRELVRWGPEVRNACPFGDDCSLLRSPLVYYSFGSAGIPVPIAQ